MERTRDTRRGTAISSNFSSSRRRSRGGFFKDSFGVSQADDGGKDSVRDRSNGGKKDRRSSRRRRLSSNNGFHVDRDGSTDESLDEDQNEEDEAIRGSSSLRRANKTKLSWKGTDEMIGVLVPRKARSASVKRFQDSVANARQSSSSSPARHSVACISPPSSNASTKSSKRVMDSPVSLKVSISESEVEVAQFLYGLTRLQSQHSPAKPDPFQGSSPQRHDIKQNSSNECSHSSISKSSTPASTPVSLPSSLHPQVLPQRSRCTSSPTVTAPKRKKPRPVLPDDKSNSALMPCSSKPGNPAEDFLSSVSNIEETKDSQTKKLEASSPKADKHAPPSISCSLDSQIPLSNSSPSLYPSQFCKRKEEHQTEENPNPCSSLEPRHLVDQEAKLHPAVPVATEMCAAEAGQTPHSHNLESTSKHGVSAFSIPDAKTKVTSSPTAHETVEGVKVPKLEIDLMAPPGNPFRDENVLDVADGGALEESANKHSLLVSESIQESQVDVNLTEKVGAEEAKLKKDTDVLDTEEKILTRENKDATSLDKQSFHESAVEPYKDESNLYKGGNKQILQKLPKSTARQAERTVAPSGVMPSTSAPPVTVPGWSGGFPPFGYPGNLSAVPSIYPLEGNAAIPNAPLVMPPQARPNRCATHCFIARLIYYQQQLAKLNPFWHAASSATHYGVKPYNLNILPSRSDAMFFSGHIMRNPSLQPGNHLGATSPANLNSQNAKDKDANISADTQRTQQLLLPQSAHPGTTFIYPVNQPRTGGRNHVTSTENASLQLGPAVTAPISASYSNISTTSDPPRYLAMLHGNYPFPVPPAYGAQITPQQQQTPPFFSGSFYPSLVQFQPHSFPQTQNMITSSGASSSQKHLQALQQHCASASSQPPPESKLKFPHPVEDVTESRVPHTQKKIQNQNAVGSQNFNPNFLPNFAIVSAAMGGKQQAQQVGGPSLLMRLKNIEVPGTVPSGHPMFQNLHDIRHLHYQLGDHLQSQAANQSKAPSKAASASNKMPESNASQSTATAAQQLQQQVMAHSKPAAPSTSDSSTSPGIAYSDIMPVVYSNAATIFPVGSREFPNMQNSPQWKMSSSQRAGQTAVQGNVFVESSVCTTEVATPGVGSPSRIGGVVKPLSSPVTTSRKVSPTGPGPLLLAQSVGSQSHAKTQQPFLSPFLSNPETSQKRQTQSISMPQGIFPVNVNIRRPSNHQTQPGAPALSVAGPASYLAGGSKGSSVYGPINGGSMAVMAAASYAQSAANLSVKSAEQKPTTA
ncbi:protein TIME FOR COFFEE-like isoform X1 [Aristolochia californica]|uniref:protein TIME FOR COFFEE-like isoform X1 n=1 Tax=Aristolochia californica TaxID=171875 RepID=UPI0035E16FC8